MSCLLYTSNMPVMDGFEVLVQMNRNHWIEDIPVVMISSDDTASNIKQAYDMGVSDYIRRPFDLSLIHISVYSERDPANGCKTGT